MELLISIPVNNQEGAVEKEALEVLNYFKKCVEDGGLKHSESLMCTMKTKQGAERHETNKCYNEDAIRIAIKHIKDAGYFVWFNRDYKGQGSYWVTNRENCPHPWYSLSK